MKILKTVFFLTLMVLSINSFSKTAIIYEYNGVRHGVILQYDLDCNSLEPAEGVTIIDCWNFSIDDNDDNTPTEAVAVLTKSSYSIKTNGNDIDFVNNITNKTIRLMSVKELKNVPEEFFVDIFSTTSKTDETVNILVTTTDPITNVTRKNSNNYSFIKAFSVTDLLEVKSENNVIVFPNPSKEDVNIFIPSSVMENFSDFKFELFDISGKKVREINQIKNSKTTFNKENLPAGKYLYRIINNEEVVDEGKIIFN